MKDQRIWTASNLLSFSRLFLVLPMTYYLLREDLASRYMALAIVIVATLTDLFDGMLARKLNEVTELGKIIDPIADKIAVGTVACILALQGRLPIWFVAAVLLRDLVIFAGGLYVKRMKNVILMSNTAGKWTVTVIAFLIAVTVIDLPELAAVKLALLWLSALMLLVSFGIYLNTFVRTMSAPASSANAAKTADAVSRH